VWRRAFLSLCLLVATRSAAFADANRIVHLHTTDDVSITGTYYPVSQSPAPAVLLIHSVARTRATWNDFAKLLQQNGIAALAIDLRGHGDSTRKLTANGPVTLDFHNFTGNDYQDMLLDVEAAIDWLLAQPEIDHQRIALAGESVGANLALRYAAINPDLAGVVVFSPGINYRSVRTDDVMAQIGHMPLRILVSHNDPVAFESCKRMVEIQKEAGLSPPADELTICTGNLHGSDMLVGVRKLPEIVLTWLKQVFRPAPAQPATTPPAAPSPDATAPTK
jgi:dienelactone hydrolase